jgi:hypothetical protein
MAVLSVAVLLLVRPAAAADKPAAGVVVDRDKRTITIDAKIAPRKTSPSRRP